MIIIIPIVIYILSIIFTSNVISNEFKTNPIQNQISDVPDGIKYKNTLDNEKIPKKMMIFKIIIFMFFILGIPLILLFFILKGIKYLINSIYMRMLLFKKFGIMRFNNINKITL